MVSSNFQNKLFQEPRPLEQLIKTQILTSNFITQNFSKHGIEVAWGQDEGFVGLLIPNCAQILLELEASYSPVNDQGQQQIDEFFLIINGIKIVLSQSPHSFTLKPDQLRAEERCQILAPSYRKLGYEVAGVNDLIREHASSKLECMVENMYKLVHSHVL